MKAILNPALLYAGLWSFLLFLYNLRLSNLLLPLSKEAFLFISTSICMFLFGYIFYSIIRNRLILSPKLDYNVYREWIFSTQTTKMLSILTKILIAGLAAELMYFQNLPLISLLGIGNTIEYTEFGFPGIHGIFNAILLVVITIIFVRQLLKPTTINLIWIILAFAWPVLLVTRQFFITIAVQFIFLYIFIKGISYKRFFKIMISLICLIFIFGYVGDMRTGRYGFIALASPTIDYPDYLPSGLLWLYIYMVSPLNNVVYNMDIAPYYAPIGIISGLIPSFARAYLMELFGVSAPAWDLVNETLNVSSMHAKFLMDFGPVFSNIIYLFISFFSYFIVKRSSFDPRYGFSLIVILHAIVLSFFTDFMFHLVFVTQIIFYIILFNRPKLYA